jgi:hypothetical protein
MAMHGNRVTNAHHEEAGLSADGHVNVPSGAASSAPPAGALDNGDKQLNPAMILEMDN